MEMEMVSQVDSTTPIVNPDAAAMAITGNLSQDLANIAKEMGVTLDASGNVAEQQPQAQPTVTPSPVPEAVKETVAPVEIPPKFQNQDGTLNEAKLEKSTKSAQEMLDYYRGLEREAQQTQNRVNNPPQVPVQPQSAQTGQPAQLTPLEIQMANDLLTESAAYGSPMTQGQAIAQARVMARGLEAKHAAEMDMTGDLRARVEDNERRRELQGMIDSDKELLSEDMAKTLWKIRQEKPWINKAPQPWAEAYLIHKGQTNGRAGQVQTPNPTGQAAKAPPTPVSPVARVLPTVDLADRKALETMDLKDLEALALKQFPGLRSGNRL